MTDDMTDATEKRGWTEAERIFFDAMYGVLPTAELAQQLNRAPASLHTRAYQRGLTNRTERQAATEPKTPAIPGFARARTANSQLRRQAEKRIAAALDAYGVERPGAELAAHLICSGLVPGVEIFIAGRTEA